MCFLQLLKLLNTDYPVEVDTRLCEKVLATLMVLVYCLLAGKLQLFHKVTRVTEQVSMDS